ncbi:MAG: hypothetical protein J7K68_05235 [Candidatus Diapherotrites archaeon]|nr:hypothetical protein [Candidatus Diapherotrites archaeon]
MPSEEEEIIQLIAQELMSGKSIDTVAGELIQAGLPRDEAYTVVNAVAQQLAARGRGRAPPRGGYAPPPRRHGSMLTYLVMIVAILILLYVIMYK